MTALEGLMPDVLERPFVPTRHRLDVEAYYKMAEAGILPRDLRVELIDGEIIDMPAIGSPHAGLVKRLVRLFAPAAGEGRVTLSVQDPLRLDSFNEPEPDVMLLRPRADDYRTSHPTASEVLLLVEVADTSLGYDSSIKIPLYATFGIPEVWIVEIGGAAIEVYRSPKDGDYAARERHSSGVLSPALVSGIAIDVAALFA
jgi:Uma2 family endonuclease